MNVYSVKAALGASRANTLVRLMLVFLRGKYFEPGYSLRDDSFPPRRMVLEVHNHLLLQELHRKSSCVAAGETDCGGSRSLEKK